MNLPRTFLETSSTALPAGLQTALPAGQPEALTSLGLSTSTNAIDQWFPITSPIDPSAEPLAASSMSHVIPPTIPILGGRHVATSGCHVATSGCHVTTSGCRVTTSGCHVTTSGCHVASPLVPSLTSDLSSLVSSRDLSSKLVATAAATSAQEKQDPSYKDTAPSDVRSITADTGVGAAELGMFASGKADMTLKPAAPGHCSYP